MAHFYLTNDLMFASRVLGMAAGMRIPLQMVGSSAALFAASQTGGCRFVLIDLALPGLNVIETIQQLKRDYPEVQLVAYGPHVHAGLLRAASESGCHAVLSRGEFNQRAESILLTYGCGEHTPSGVD